MSDDLAPGDLDPSLQGLVEVRKFNFGLKFPLSGFFFLMLFIKEHTKKTYNTIDKQLQEYYTPLQIEPVDKKSTDV